MYATNTELSASSRCSTRWNDPRSTRVETPIAAAGTPMPRGIPARPSAAAMPANCPHSVPRLAPSSAISATAVQRTP